MQRQWCVPAETIQKHTANAKNGKCESHSRQVQKRNVTRREIKQIRIEN